MIDTTPDVSKPIAELRHAGAAWDLAARVRSIVDRVRKPVLEARSDHDSVEMIAECIVTLRPLADRLINQVREWSVNVLAATEDLAASVRIEVESEVGTAPVHYEVIGTVGLESRRRPFAPGDSVGHASFPNSSGSIGCLVRGRKQSNRSLYVLSCSHVLDAGFGAVSRHVVQPGTLRKGSHPADTIGRLHWSGWPKAADDLVLDAAIARVDPIDCHPLIRNIGRIGRGTPALKRGSRVRKFGDTTQRRAGEFVGVVPDFKSTIAGIERSFGEVYEFVGVEAELSLKGDSGSLIVMESGNVPVALLFAGSPHVGPNKRTFGIPIERVLRATRTQIVRTHADLRRCL